jgi:hypothetical protein
MDETTVKPLSDKHLMKELPVDSVIAFSKSSFSRIALDLLDLSS